MVRQCVVEYATCKRNNDNMYIARRNHKLFCERVGQYNTFLICLRRTVYEYEHTDTSDDQYTQSVYSSFRSPCIAYLHSIQFKINQIHTQHATTSTIVYNVYTLCALLSPLHHFWSTAILYKNRWCIHNPLKYCYSIDG